MPAETAHMKTHTDKLSASWQEALHAKDKVKSEILIYWRISTRILKLTQIDYMWLSSFVFLEEINKNDKTCI